MSRLCVAAEAGNFQEVKRLVESGVDVNHSVWLGKPALHYAVASGQLKMVKFLVENDASVNSKNSLSNGPLHDAIKIGSLEMVKYLVEKGAEVASEHNHGEDTVLYFACEKGNELIVEDLLQNGAIKDIDRYIAEQHSPLSIACYQGHTAVVQTLLDFNVDIRKEKDLICGNDEIMNIIHLHRTKKSIKHREKIQILKTMDDQKLTKVRIRS